MTMVSERDTSELELVEDDFEKSSVFPSAGGRQQEWSIHSKVNVWNKTKKKVINKKTVRFPGFSAAAKVSRKPQFFIWNIIIILVSSCSVSFL